MSSVVAMSSQAAARGRPATPRVEWAKAMLARPTTVGGRPAAATTTEAALAEATRETARVVATPS
jgi:hypothetical protein